MTEAVKVLTAKKETVYGTDAAPTLAANAVVTRNFRASPLITDPLERNLDRGSFGATPIVATNRRQELSYELEIAGSGTAGTAPAWMEFLEACGMAPPGQRIDHAGDLLLQFVRWAAIHAQRRLHDDHDAKRHGDALVMHARHRIGPRRLAVRHHEQRGTIRRGRLQPGPFQNPGHFLEARALQLFHDRPHRDHAAAPPFIADSR